MADYEIIPRQHFPEPRARIHLAVMWDGEVVWKAPRQTHRFCHEANLIILNVEGSDLLEVWKERYALVPHGVLLTHQQAGLLAAAHVILISPERFGFDDRHEALGVTRSRLSTASLKLLGE